MHAVEGMREVDDPVLLPDRRDGLCERHPAWDLLPQVKADHLALPVCLDLLAGNDDELVIGRKLCGLEGAADGVVVGYGDRAEADCLRMHDEVCWIDGAVVRPARVHVEVAEDPLAVGERLRRRARPMTPFGELLVQRVELAGDVREALAFGLPERALGLAPAKVGVLGEPCDLGARELGLLSHPGWWGDCTTGCGCLEPDAFQPRERRDEDAGLREERRSRRAVASRPDVHAVAKRSRDRGPPGEG